MKLLHITFSFSLVCQTSCGFQWSTRFPFSTIKFRTQCNKRTNLFATESPFLDNHPLPSSCSDNVHEEGFWGKRRSSQELISFVESVLSDGSESNSFSVEVVNEEPPLILVHDCLTKEECQEVINATMEDSSSWKRSTVGNDQESTEDRTSSTVWLKEYQCEGPLRKLASIASHISTIPPSHMENLQVVRYKPGEEFTLHTDHLDSFNDLVCRGRLSTFLVYLNDVEKGGETEFPGFNGLVQPKRGSAIFFWNTKERPGMPGYHPLMKLNVDIEMRHAGLPVIEGEKWICNRWIHPIELEEGVRGTAKTREL